MVPQNLYNTISAESFSTYMGIGKCDLRFDLQQTGNIAGKAAEIAETLEQDGSVLRYTVLTTKTFQVKSDNGLSERIKIELGNHRVFPLQYSKGRAPASENEIALSALNAAELGKQVGDTMTLVVSGKEKNLTVCGIYSDITNGGKTAKAAFTDDTADIMWSVIYTELSDKSLAAEKAYEYGNKFEFAKVSDINEFINQTFGSTRSSIGKISNAALAVALLLTVLITLLFMKMLVAKERYSIAAMKALGFTKKDITLQYISRSVFILITGLLLGILLADTLGGWLAGLVISQLGASSFHFTINPLSAYLINPFMMACTVLIATRIGTAGTGQIRISENIKE
jgi:putative ABC transport system permease protein